MRRPDQSQQNYLTNKTVIWFSIQHLQQHLCFVHCSTHSVAFQALQILTGAWLILGWHWARVSLSEVQDLHSEKQDLHSGQQSVLT